MRSQRAGRQAPHRRCLAGVGWSSPVSPLALVFVAPAAYQLLVVIAALRRRDKIPAEPFQPPVSILKPLRGIDPNTYEAFVSHVRLQYPHFEILFGAASENDPAVEEVRHLQRAFPQGPIRLIIGRAPALNGKIGTLIELARHARYPIHVVNDSDIKVGRDYLSHVIAPLADPTVGVVTCPYRVKPHNIPSAWEALGIATDFMPSTLVAQLLGVREFGLGSTLAFRAADLEQAGGFESIADYLADDFQLAKRISRLSKRSFLSSYTVETSLGDATWSGVWRHQLRWARTIRTSKGKGYAGLPITHAGVWSLSALLCGMWPVAALLLFLRVGSAAFASRGTRWFWLAPIWDLYAFAVWLASYAGRTVRWRDQALSIDRHGRIIRSEPTC